MPDIELSSISLKVSFFLLDPDAFTSVLFFLSGISVLYAVDLKPLYCPLPVTVGSFNIATNTAAANIYCIINIMLQFIKIYKYHILAFFFGFVTLVHVRR